MRAEGISSLRSGEASPTQLAPPRHGNPSHGQPTTPQIGPQTGSDATISSNDKASPGGDFLATLIYEYQIQPDQVLRLKHGDLTEERVDVIVNAANANLVHGGGVAAAIVRRGGNVIQEESHRWVEEHGPITQRQPAITSAGDLPCQYVIHAVGPVWGEGNEDQKLKTAVTGALQMAGDYQLKSLAMPAISTGIFGFPKDRGARLIVDSIVEYFHEDESTSLEIVCITLIDQPSVEVFHQEFIARWGNRKT